jgi:peroxiredoxin
MFGKTYMGITRSHFAIDEEGNLMESKIKVKPETTADLALKVIQP